MQRRMSNAPLNLCQGYAAYTTDFDSSAGIFIDGLRLEAKDVSFYMDRKTGIFPLKDTGAPPSHLPALSILKLMARLNLGLLDFKIGSESLEGLSARITVEVAGDEDAGVFLVVNDAQVDIK
jgi:hypothetical protein